MIEYIRDVIRAKHGEPCCINAYVKDEDGGFTVSDCAFMLHDEEGNILTMVEGKCDSNLWSFELTKETMELPRGKYSYCIHRDGESLCFNQPFYIV